MEEKIAHLESSYNSLNDRVSEQQKRFDKLDASIDKMWTRIDEYRSNAIITQTILETVRKDMNDNRLENAKMFERFNDKLDGLSQAFNVSEGRNSEKQSNKAIIPSWVGIGLTIVSVATLLYTALHK